jgi:hypothetical protein
LRRAKSGGRAEGLRRSPKPVEMVSTSFSASRQELERLVQAPVDLLGQSAEQNRATPTQVALAWLLAQNRGIVPIRAHKAHHLEENRTGRLSLSVRCPLIPKASSRRKNAGAWSWELHGHALTGSNKTRDRLPRIKLGAFCFDDSKGPTGSLVRPAVARATLIRSTPAFCGPTWVQRRQKTKN